MKNNAKQKKANTGSFNVAKSISERAARPCTAGVAFDVSGTIIGRAMSKPARLTKPRTRVAQAESRVGNSRTKMIRYKMPPTAVPDVVKHTASVP